jgi:hypothetical protein
MTVRFADEIARIRDAAEWKSADRHAVSLVKDDALNVLLMVLKKSARLHEHRTKGPITLQLISVPSASAAVRTSASFQRARWWP